MNKSLLLCGALTLVSSTSLFAEPLKADSKTRDNASHGLGYLKGREFAHELMKSGYAPEDFSVEAVAKGFSEAFAGKDSSKEGSDFTVALEVMKALLLQREQELAKVNEAKIGPWLEQTVKLEGIKKTDSGLLYKVITQGKGVTYSSKSDYGKDKKKQLRFFVSYQGKLPDGTVFEATPEGKVVAVADGALPGVTEALKMMPTGSTWELYLKPALAYGMRRPNAKVGPNSCVVFTVTLAEIKDLSKVSAKKK